MTSEVLCFAGNLITGEFLFGRVDEREINKTLSAYRMDLGCGEIAWAVYPVDESKDLDEWTEIHVGEFMHYMYGRARRLWSGMETARVSDEDAERVLMMVV